MPQYGRNIITQSGKPILVQATTDVTYPMMGVSLCWAVVTALAAPYTDSSGISLQAGQFMVRFGQVLVPILSGGNTGLWGPYDPAAGDGRQNDPAPGKTIILNETVVKGGASGLDPYNDTQLSGLTGGTVHIDRVIQAGSGTASLANGPTWAKLYAALPTLVPFKL